MKNIFKYASLLMAAAMLFSCHGTIDPETQDPEPGPGPGPDPTPENLELKLTSDRNLIQTNVDAATLTVTLGEEVLTEGVTFYDVDFNEMNIPDFKFKASKAGDYVIVASYGTYISESITVKATDLAIPASPVDPQPSNMSFKARVLLTEFTTVGCSACPAMKRILHNLEEDAEMADKIIFTECHSGLVNSVADPCYLHDRAFEDYCAITGFPTVKLDIDYLLKDRNGIRTVIDELVAAKESTVPGIAVNSKLENGNVVAKVTVKAAADASYRVGAFLLEDGIYAKQTNADADWMNTHDNVIRYVDESYKAKYYGYPVADIKAGKTADIMFSWYLDDIWEYGSNKGAINGGIAWPERNDEKLHMVVYVSMSDGQGGYYVANAIDCPISGETPFEYR